MKNIFPILLSIFLFTACNNSQTKNKTDKDQMMQNENPLLSESTLPYHAPDFRRITSADFKPALLKGIEEQKQAVAEIADNTDEPTFENTILALEKSGDLLQRVENIFDALTEAETNDTLQAVQEEMAPLLSEKKDAIYLNE